MHIKTTGKKCGKKPKKSIGMDITDVEITSKQNLRSTFISQKNKVHLYEALFKKQ